MFSAERLWLSGRILSAAVGGYLLAMASCLCLGQLPGLSDNDARMLTTLIFFLIYLLIVLTVFAIASHRRAILTCWMGNALLWPLGLWLTGGQLS